MRYFVGTPNGGYLVHDENFTKIDDYRYFDGVPLPWSHISSDVYTTTPILWS